MRSHVNLQVQKLRKEKCCGCKIDHPSQRRHDCLMMTEEGWITYELEAIEHILEKGILWRQFREAIRIMQLIPHDHARNHFQKLSSDREATLELLRDLMFKTSLSEYQDIPGYLYYWQKEHKHFRINNNLIKQLLLLKFYNQMFKSYPISIVQ